MQFIWKYQGFDAKNLSTSDNQNMIVFNPGNQNRDTGPDFEEARIKIGDIDWAEQKDLIAKQSRLSESLIYRNGILKNYNRTKINVYGACLTLKSQRFDSFNLEQKFYGFIKK